MGGLGAVNGDGWADVIGTFSMYPEVPPQGVAPAGWDRRRESLVGRSSAEMLAVLRRHCGPHEVRKMPS